MVIPTKPSITCLSSVRSENIYAFLQGSEQQRAFGGLDNFSKNHSGYVYLRAGVDLPQSLVFETVVSTKTVGGAERLVALSTWMFLEYLQYKENA